MEYTHIHIHPEAKPKQSKKKKKRTIDWPGEQRKQKNDIHQLRTKLTKQQTGKQIKAGCQLGSKALKTKPANKYSEKKKEK